LIAIPLARIGRIEVGPAVAFSRGVIDLALEARVDLALLDGHGQTRGYVATASGRRAGLLVAQAGCCLDRHLALLLARKVVDARMRNQRCQLNRLNRTRNSTAVATALESMARNLRKVDSAESVEALRGIEGASTAAYWPALGQLLEPPLPGPLKRSRPAGDGVNASINYLTGVLERDVRASVQAASLHPGIACLHGSRDDHDGLVYDLMEPFRAPLTEGLVVYLINARRVRPEMISVEEDGQVGLSADARKALILGYETAVARRVNRPGGGGKLAWRSMMRFQAQRLAEAFRARDPALFQPYLMEA
jgi:CRISPR-associated protein Cas1